MGASGRSVQKPEMTRGVRNHNPGNIRRVDGQVWKGQSASQTDPDFVQFDDPVYGIRALTVLLLNYYRWYGLNTVEQIINRWAPSVENDTTEYVRVVAMRMGVAPDKALDLYKRNTLRSLVTAIIWVETGGYEYSADVIEHGVSMAVSESRAKLRLRDAARTDTGRGSAMAATATVIGSIGTITTGLADLDWRLGVVVVIVCAVMSVVAVWLWRTGRD